MPRTLEHLRSTRLHAIVVHVLAKFSLELIEARQLSRRAGCSNLVHTVHEIVHHSSHLITSYIAEGSAGSVTLLLGTWQERADRSAGCPETPEPTLYQYECCRIAAGILGDVAGRAHLDQFNSGW